MVTDDFNDDTPRVRECEPQGTEENAEEMEERVREEFAFSVRKSEVKTLLKGYYTQFEKKKKQRKLGISQDRKLLVAISSF